MKVKLLKKLRRRFVIYERNGSYVLIDMNNGYTFRMAYRVSLIEIKAFQRMKILEEARENYWKLKRKIL